MKEIEEIKGLMEALLYIAHEPLSINFFARATGEDSTKIKIGLDSLVDEYLERDGGLLIIELAGGYQFVTNSRYSEQIRNLFVDKKREKLSKSVLEVLAIIAYKQPIHAAAVENLRGSSSRQQIGQLMSLGLVKPVERLELPGRPMGYGTTQEFLKFLGINSLKDMPKLADIKDINFEPLNGNGK